MIKPKMVLALFAFCSLSVFAENAPLSQTAVVKSTSENQQPTPTLQNTLITFNPITTSDTRSAVIRPNEYNKTRKMHAGAFLEAFWKSGDKRDPDNDDSSDRIFGGANLTFVANDKFSTLIGIGGMFDGGYFVTEFAIDYNFKPYVIRENSNGTTSEPIGVYSSNGPVLSNTESVYGTKHTMALSLGGGVLVGFPLRKELDWTVTPRVNISLAYSPEKASKLSIYLRLSPGATLGSKDKTVKTAFNMGISAGVKYKLI